jgi:hypothetical protein
VVPEVLRYPAVCAEPGILRVIVLGVVLDTAVVVPLLCRVHPLAHDHAPLVLVVGREETVVMAAHGLIDRCWEGLVSRVQLLEYGREIILMLLKQILC